MTQRPNRPRFPGEGVPRERILADLAEMQAGTMRPGYVISATGVQLGLDSTVSGFASTDLAPTGLAKGTRLWF